MIQVIYVLSAIIILGGVLGFMLFQLKNKRIEVLKEEKKDLIIKIGNQERDLRIKESLLETKDDTITEMKAHATRVNLTEKELDPIKKTIQEAQTDEEAFSVVADIISRNNNRL